MKPVNDILWAMRTRDEIPEIAAQGAVVIVPIASIEQHGVALPVNTDIQTVEYVSRQAACMLDDVPVLVTPTIPFGISPHHMVHGGTITVQVRTLVAYLKNVCQSIVTDGFDRIIILSGHGGNDSTINAAALELKHELQRQIEGFCWFGLIPDTFIEVNEGPGRNIGHAGEAEASCILALAPETVHMDKARFVEGISDDPILGTAEKGKKILEAGAKALAEYVRAMAARPGKRVVGIKKAQK